MISQCVTDNRGAMDQNPGRYLVVFVDLARIWRWKPGSGSSQILHPSIWVGSASDWIQSLL